jgi:hypothetical protein
MQDNPSNNMQALCYSSRKYRAMCMQLWDETTLEIPVAWLDVIGKYRKMAPILSVMFHFYFIFFLLTMYVPLDPCFVTICGCDLEHVTAVADRSWFVHQRICYPFTTPCSRV